MLTGKGNHKYSPVCRLVFLQLYHFLFNISLSEISIHCTIILISQFACCNNIHAAPCSLCFSIWRRSVHSTKIEWHFVCRRACRSIGRHNTGYNNWSYTTLYCISPKQKVSEKRSTAVCSARNCNTVQWNNIVLLSPVVVDCSNPVTEINRPL